MFGGGKQKKNEILWISNLQKADYEGEYAKVYRRLVKGREQFENVVDQRPGFDHWTLYGEDHTGFQRRR